MSGAAADWIAVDWGTTRLRAWAIGEAGVLDHRMSDDGMNGLAAGGFRAALDALTAGWSPDAPVIACGMVGSRQGWVEAPYATVPCPPLTHPFARVPGTRAVHIVPGLKQMSPADVMRGEETQIAGFMALNPGWDGILCLPGTHTKWAEISAGEVVSFRTFMTGELFATLTGHSVLRHSAGEGWSETAFEEAVAETLSRPEGLAAGLFRIRAEDLLRGASKGAATARLSGMLIGAELAASRPYWLGQQVAIIGAERIATPYSSALALQGSRAEVKDATDMTLAGLAAARARMGELT